MLIDKLKRLEVNLNSLTKMREEYSLDKFLSNKFDEWALRYGLFESCQLIIDISCKFVADRNLGYPKSYAECVKLLAVNNYIDIELGKRLTGMIGLRNLLVHEYSTIELEKLFQVLNNLGDIQNFLRAISKAI